MVDQAQLREWQKLSYYDPEPLMVRLAQLGDHPFLQGLPYKIASLRTHTLRPYFEGRLGVIFFYLIGQVVGAKVTFAQVEKADYDFVSHYQLTDGEHRFVPVQMKELVPDHLNASTDLQSLINDLKKYVDSADLTVAIHVNRVGKIIPKDIDLTGLNIGSLWLFGATKPDQSTWLVIGDLMKDSWDHREFDHPRKPWHLDGLW